MWRSAPCSPIARQITSLLKQFVSDYRFAAAASPPGLHQLPLMMPIAMPKYGLVPEEALSVVLIPNASVKAPELSDSCSQGKCEQLLQLEQSYGLTY